jgi:competence protein ComEA
MPDLDRRRAALVGIVALAVVAMAVWQLRGRGTAPAAPPAAALPVESAGASSRGEVIVHVAGAVRRPGVYRLRTGARVDDAVRRAGGVTGRADLSAVNLAAPLEDGRQVLVPRRQAVGGGGAVAGGGASAAGGASAGGGPAAKVNLNTATAEELDGLAGVGPATAAKILAHREQHGAFGSVEELGDVPGIGEVRLAALRDLVTV